MIEQDTEIPVGVRLPRGILASVRRARHSAASRVESLQGKIREYDRLLKQYGEGDSEDETETEESSEELPEENPARRRRRKMQSEEADG